MPSESAGSPESITALDYIESQRQLEDDARDVLPYDPTHCTYFDGPLRQPVYACLTCTGKSKSKTPSGVCYSCSIQCHSDHDLVELFNKRNFTCDCGTTRMSAFGGCNLRKNFTELDIPSSSNRYDHNFEGRFCSCDQTYNPESEKGTMYQCLLGDVCNEDWYHEECILGLPFPPLPHSPKTAADFLDLKKKMPHSPKGHPTKVMIDLAEGEVSESAESEVKQLPKSPKGHPTGVTLYPLDLASFGTAAAKKDPKSPKGHPTGVNLLPQFSEDIPESVSDDDSDGEDHIPPPGFPDDSLFEAFICWRCVQKHRQVLGRWAGWPGVALDAVARKRPEDDVESTAAAISKFKDSPTLKRTLEQSEVIEPHEPPAKRVETDDFSASVSSDASLGARNTTASTSVLSNSECKMPIAIPSASEFSLFLVDGWRDNICRCASCLKFLDRFPMLGEEEVTYEPPRDEDEPSSLLDAGARALNSMPHVNAIEGLYAYNQVKTKLASFLKPFADEGRIVSEQDVKAFFADIKGK